MSLRVALVIDGETQGAQQALKDTSEGIKELGSEAQDASGPVGDISDSLRETASAAPEASGGIIDVGEALSQTGDKFGSFKSIALGAIGGIAAGFATAGIAAAIGVATEAFINFVAEISSDLPRINRDLEAHEGLIKDIKSAYDELNGGASSYGLNSLTGNNFEAQQNILRLAEDYKDSVGSMDLALTNFSQRVSGRGLFGLFSELDSASPFAAITESFKADIAAGTADVIEFRDEIKSIGESLDTDDPFRKTGENLLAVTDKAAGVQAELQRAADLYKGLGGDADAAARALGGSADKFEQVGQAALGALPSLRDVDEVLKSIASGQDTINISGGAGVALTNPANVAIQPHASGGIVNAPTLFSFGAGQVGLMGEAGEEAILPMSGGMVGAKGAAGKETSLPLTRLAGGNLGVSLVSPTPFAKGGTVTRFASGGIVPGALTSAGVGLVGQRIAALIAELSAIGQTTDLGAEMVDQLKAETDEKDQAISQSPARVATIENEAAALGQMSSEMANQTSLLDTAKGAWRNFFVEIGRATKDGVVTADEWGSAISGAFDSLRDKALALAADGIWDLIAGAFSSGFSGGFGSGSGGGFGNILGSLISGIFGFADGGWTGDMATGQIAGPVHGQEFVVKAGPARQNRAALEAMNTGTPFNADTGQAVFAPTTIIDARGSSLSESRLKQLLDQRDQAWRDGFGAFFADQSRRAVV